VAGSRVAQHGVKGLGGAGGHRSCSPSAASRPQQEQGRRQAEQAGPPRRHLPPLTEPAAGSLSRDDLARSPLSSARCLLGVVVRAAARSQPRAPGGGNYAARRAGRLPAGGWSGSWCAGPAPRRAPAGPGRSPAPTGRPRSSPLRRVPVLCALVRVVAYSYVSIAAPLAEGEAHFLSAFLFFRGWSWWKT